MSEARENLGKYIQLEDDEKSGAKKGYVIDELIARKASEDEVSHRSKGGLSPEESNRKAEKAIIKRSLELKATRDDVVSQMDNSLEIGNDPANISAEGASSKAKEVVKEYEKFVAEKDAEELDKLRAQIRKENQK